MEVKSLEQYLKKRLNEAEIAEIEMQVELEMEFLQTLQKEKKG